MRFFDYLFIQYKRIFKLLPGIVTMIVILAVLLGLAGAALVYSGTYQEDQQKYRLGVVGETDDEMISLGIYMLETLDESRYMIEMVQFDSSEEAREALRDADISAYIVITEEFSDALNAMTNDSKLTYYATSGQKGITNVMMDEIASVASNIIVYSEKGICTLRQIMKDEGYDKATRSAQIDDLFMVYLAALITRTNVAEITELGLSDGLSTPAYYFLGILLFFMLLLSFCAISFFIGQKNAQYRFMKSKGVGARQQILAEYMAFLTINIVCTAITVALVAILIRLGIFEFDEFGRHQLRGLLEFSYHLIPVCIMFSSLGFMIFEILIGVINKILVAFMIYIGMGYVSGYFYPKTFFPELVQSIGEIIPSGVAFKYLGAVLLGDDYGIILLEMMGYTIVFMIMTIIVRRQKIK